MPAKEEEEQPNPVEGQQYSGFQDNIDNTAARPVNSNNTPEQQKNLWGHQANLLHLSVADNCGTNLTDQVLNLKG